MQLLRNHGQRCLSPYCQGQSCQFGYYASHLHVGSWRWQAVLRGDSAGGEVATAAEPAWEAAQPYNDTTQSHRPLRHAWIQDVADTVPEKIDGQHGKQNGDAREGREPPGNVDIVSSQGDHLAPGRGIHLRRDTVCPQCFSASSCLRCRGSGKSWI